MGKEIASMYCQCGCGFLVPADKKGRPRKFIPGHRLGPHVPGWKGGTRKRGRYLMVLKPNHPRADSRGYVHEHILVMESALGRLLTPLETVHHIDENPLNNGIYNLMLFKKPKMHHAYHHRLNAFRECGHYDWRKCIYCHQYDDPAKMTLTSNSRAYHKNCAAEYQRGSGC